jgi:hypothetical protein
MFQNNLVLNNFIVLFLHRTDILRPLPKCFCLVRMFHPQIKMRRNFSVVFVQTEISGLLKSAQRMLVHFLGPTKSSGGVWTSKPHQEQTTPTIECNTSRQINRPVKLNTPDNFSLLVYCNFENRFHSFILSIAN